MKSSRLSQIALGDPISKAKQKAKWLEFSSSGRNCLARTGHGFYPNYKKIN
jgi:hypothetical protein